MKIVILSDGLAGFMLAHVLSKKGHVVTLIDTDQGPQTERRFYDFGIHFLPDTPRVRNGLALLEECFGKSFDTQVVQTTPLTFKDGKLEQFIGFGESSSKSIEPLGFFNKPSRLVLNLSDEALVQLAVQKGEFKFLPFSEISAFHFKHSTKSSRLEKITINGQTDIEADQFFYLNTPSNMLPLLPQELIGVRARSRLEKSSSWARISLKCVYETPIVSNDALLFLLPNQPDQLPCVGQIEKLGALQLSNWLTFIPGEMVEDAAYVSSGLKEIRKLVRKAFHPLEPAPKESVSVELLAAADLSWIFENDDLMGVAENFHFVPRLAAQSQGLAQSVECVSRACCGLFPSADQYETYNTSPTLLQHP